MAEAALDPAPRRASRFWLFAPIVVLIVAAAGWSAAWFVFRNRAAEGLDAFLAAEARAGREWTCKDRSIGGFPFRIEVACAELAVVREGVSVSLGRVESVAQVYDPRFVITEIEGPMTATDGRVSVRGSWRLLETSVRGTREGLQRVSVVAQAPRFVVAGAAPEDVVVSAEGMELHVRPNPNRTAEGAVDAALRLRGANLPLLDAALSDVAPTSFETDLTATQVLGLRGGSLPEELERWRAAGGKLDILEFSLTKGGKRIDAKGTLALDDLHRPTGELTLATAGLDTLISSLGGNGLAASLLAGLFGSGPAAPGAAPTLKALPPIRLDNGRVRIGPVSVPRLLLWPLY